MASRPAAAVVALDQGTTGSTSLVFGPEGEVLGRAYGEIVVEAERKGGGLHGRVVLPPGLTGRLQLASGPRPLSGGETTF